MLSDLARLGGSEGPRLLTKLSVWSEEPYRVLRIFSRPILQTKNCVVTSECLL